MDEVPVAKHLLSLGSEAQRRVVAGPLWPRPDKALGVEFRETLEQAVDAVAQIAIGRVVDLLQGDRVGPRQQREAGGQPLSGLSVWTPRASAAAITSGWSPPKTAR